MAGNITFTDTVGGFAPPKEADVVTRRVRITVDGTERPPVDMPMEQSEIDVTGLTAPGTYTVDYCHVDGAGNVGEFSDPTTIEVTDDVAPARPDGHLAVARRVQVDAAAPAPEPTAPAPAPDAGGGGAPTP